MQVRSKKYKHQDSDSDAETDLESNITTEN